MGEPIVFDPKRAMDPSYFFDNRDGLRCARKYVGEHYQQRFDEVLALPECLDPVSASKAAHEGTRRKAGSKNAKTKGAVLTPKTKTKTKKSKSKTKRTKRTKGRTGAGGIFQMLRP